MFCKRIIEEKKRLGLTARIMSARSRRHIPEESISRILSERTADPGILTVLDLAETVELKPYELFMDSVTAQEFRAYLDLKSKSSEIQVERIKILAENEDLKSTNAALLNKIAILEIKLEASEKLVRVYDHFVNIEDKE